MNTTSPGNRPYMISYAQNFEDVILERIFKGVEAGFYVDIGACHPVYDSVTQHFYLKGWNGINVEPQPELFAELQLYRDRDINLNLCIGNSTEQQTLHITSDLGTSTLVPSLAENYLKTGSVSQAINVEVIPLNVLWEKHVSGREVDFLKIDVEGYETAVLESVDFSLVTPQMLVIEAVHPITHAPNHHEWEHHLNRHYQFCYFDGLNRFYRRKDLNLPASCFNSPPNVFDQFKTYREHLAEEAQKHLQAETESHFTRIQHLEAMLEQKDGALADASAAYQTLRSQFDEKLAELQSLTKPEN
jgi:FkbM family methyltransferase